MAHEQKELDNLEAVRAWKEAYKKGPGGIYQALHR